MSKLVTYAGIAASVILIAFGIGSIVVGFNGRDRVHSDLAREQIVGTPDSTIPGQKVDTGSEAQMGRFLDKAGKPTNDEKAAAVQNGKPVDNPARQIWVTETALTTALNTSYFAESVATFAIVMGAALLLVGIGFLVMIVRLLLPATRREGSRFPVPAVPAAG